MTETRSREGLLITNEAIAQMQMTLRGNNNGLLKSGNQAPSYRERLSLKQQRNASLRYIQENRVSVRVP